ncbi:hypothetical protein ACOTTU_02580 [Roseobacter sp. EG26]|uniref:hypothetical protein n=1 Tax=Roseobacter sp. EG26 TaxID=3412477 RepID=UPI003CE48E60
MNVGGQPVLGRSTMTSGRTLFGISMGVILSMRLEIDTSAFEFAGVRGTPEQLATGMLWVLGSLWLSLAINWMGDLINLGKYNSAMTQKRGETNIGGMNRTRGRLQALIEVVENEREARALAGPNEDKLSDRDLLFISRELTELKNSQWWHSRMVWFYLVVWSFLIPSCLAAYAGCLLTYA